MIIQKPRQIAVRVLSKRQTSKDFVEKLLEFELANQSLAPADRALCQELVYGIVRWQGALDWLVARKTASRPQNASLRSLLHLGLYQIFWLERIPDHAAVNETVQLAKELGLGPRSGFVNAILRGYIRERDQTRALLESLKDTDPAVGYSHPAWLVARWLGRWGKEKTTQLLKWNNSSPPTFARVNELKTDGARLPVRWGEEGVSFEERRFDWTGPQLVYEMQRHPPLTTMGSFQDGWFYIQDPSTLLSTRALDPKSGETILDMCAAPGGKTTHIAARMGNRGHIVAQDIQPARLKLLEENCRRLGATCIEVTNGRGLYDRILIDAPCSNTGVLRRRVDARWRLKPDELERLCQSQSALLARAVTELKPGGILVYSTCSLEPDENEQTIQKFLAENSDFVLESERQLLPFVEEVDGAYVATVRRK